MEVVEKLLIAEVLLLVALAFGVLGLLGSVRVPLVAGRKVRFKDIAISHEGWPERAQQLSNAFDNQLQLPVFFYLGVVLTLITGGAGWLEVIVGAAFVILRYVHAAIHVTDNNIPRRFLAYSLGFFVLVAYWLVLAFRVAFA